MTGGRSKRRFTFSRSRGCASRSETGCALPCPRHRSVRVGRPTSGLAGRLHQAGAERRPETCGQRPTRKGRGTHRDSQKGSVATAAAVREARRRSRGRLLATNQRPAPARLSDPAKTANGEGSQDVDTLRIDVAERAGFGNAGDWTRIPGGERASLVLSGG